jgi:hypothetical protein
MAVSVLTLISVPEGRVCCALALNAVKPANSVAKRIRFIMVEPSCGFLEMDALAKLRVAPFSQRRTGIAELHTRAGSVQRKKPDWKEQR